MASYKLLVFRTNASGPQVITISCPSEQAAIQVAVGMAREATMVEIWHVYRFIRTVFHTSEPRAVVVPHHAA